MRGGTGLLPCEDSPASSGQGVIGEEADMRVRPYHSARSTAAHLYHEDDECPAGRQLAWFDKVDGTEGCEPCPVCASAATPCPEHAAAAAPAR